MIHQPLGGARGQATDIEIQAREIRHTKEVLLQMLLDFTGQPREKVAQDIERDFYMSPRRPRSTASSTRSSISKKVD